MAVAEFYMFVFKAIIIYAVKANEWCLGYFLLLWKSIRNEIPVFPSCRHQSDNSPTLVKYTLSSIIWMLMTHLTKISYMNSVSSYFVW